MKIVIDGLLGFIVTFGTSACALLSQPHVTTTNDVAQAAWLIAAAGAIVGAAKTIQSRMAQPPDSVD